MEKYANLGRDSGVLGHEIAPDKITIMFKGGKKPYTYSYKKAGQQHVESMKRLAKSGHGLNSYIMKRVKNLFD